MKISAQEYRQYKKARRHALELPREWLKFEPRRDRATRQHLAVIALLFVCQAIPFVLVMLLGTGCQDPCHYVIQSAEYRPWFRECMTHVTSNFPVSECDWRAWQLGYLERVCK